MMLTLRPAEEVREESEYFADIGKGKLDKEMVELAEKVIEQKSGPFDPEESDRRPLPGRAARTRGAEDQGRQAGRPESGVGAEQRRQSRMPCAKSIAADDGGTPRLSRRHAAGGAARARQQAHAADPHTPRASRRASAARRDLGGRRERGTRQQPHRQTVRRQRRDDLADMRRVARLDHDIDLGELHRNVEEQALVIDFEDVSAALAHDARDRGQRARHVGDLHPSLRSGPARAGTLHDRGIGSPRVHRRAVMKVIVLMKFPSLLRLSRASYAGPFGLEINWPSMRHDFPECMRSP